MARRRHPQSTRSTRSRFPHSRKQVSSRRKYLPAGESLLPISESHRSPQKTDLELAGSGLYAKRNHLLAKISRFLPRQFHSPRNTRCLSRQKKSIPLAETSGPRQKNYLPRSAKCLLTKKNSDPVEEGAFPPKKLPSSGFRGPFPSWPAAIAPDIAASPASDTPLTER